MNDHDAMQKQLSAYCGDDLEQAERMRVEEHLAGCALCSAELADLQTAAAPDPNNSRVGAAPLAGHAHHGQGAGAAARKTELAATNLFSAACQAAD